MKVRRGGIEYGIGTIPLGGYVKITGMNPAEELPPAESIDTVPRVLKQIGLMGLPDGATTDEAEPL